MLEQNQAIIEKEPDAELVDLPENMNPNNVPHFSRMIKLTYNKKITEYVSIDQLQNQIDVCKRVIEENQNKIETLEPLIEKLKKNQLKDVIKEEKQREKEFKEQQVLTKES